MSRDRFTKVLKEHVETIDTPLNFCMWALGELAYGSQDHDWKVKDMEDFAYEAVIIIMRREKDDKKA